MKNYVIEMWYLLFPVSFCLFSVHTTEPEWDKKTSLERELFCNVISLRQETRNEKYYKNSCDEGRKKKNRLSAPIPSRSNEFQVQQLSSNARKEVAFEERL